MTASSVERALRGLALALAASVPLLGVGVQDAHAAHMAWAIRTVAEPSTFSTNDQLICEQGKGKCDRYQFEAANVGSEASTAGVTLTIKLPAGITTHEENVVSGESPEGIFWQCTSGAGISVLTCTFAEAVPIGGYLPFIDVRVNSPAAGLKGPLSAEFTLEGGGAPTVSRTLVTPINAVGRPPFEVTQFAVEPLNDEGLASSQAGGHPWTLNTTFSDSTTFSEESVQIPQQLVPIRNVKDAVVDLPLGMTGNPQATSKCTQPLIDENQCPPASRVGTFLVIGGAFESGEFAGTGAFCCSAVYNMVPEQGYPAEFAFRFAGQVITLYASVIRGSSGYHLRAAATGLPAVLEVSASVITFFGDPAAARGEAPGAAFLTNPTDCSTPSIASHLEVKPWEAPQSPVLADAVAYSQLTGCESLHFAPTFGLGPSSAVEEGTTQADEPSAYTADLEVPQTTGSEELGTPPLKDASVTLPAGVSVSPSAAQGLTGCAPNGPQGINLGSEQIGPEGQDIGDPEATELGAGHAGGNGSPYDDGLYHTAPGHCPASSTLGTVEVSTPLLPAGPGGTAALNGHVYLAEPRCGGAAQPACTEASATNGELYGVYVEAAGSGVIVKLAGSVAADLATGQLRATFANNPQFPFSHLRFHFRGGPRAPLANPQTCGSYAASSLFTSWAGQEAPVASTGFTIDGDGAGAPCPAISPFAPHVLAGSSVTSAGAFTPFVLEVTRQDREQDLASLTETLPPGLLARITGIPLCEEAAANAGTCGAESQIGTASAVAGPGSTPLTIGGGRVYLTGPYKGAPYGMSIVQPAVAGPFNLGNVVVRAAIHVDPATTAITVVSDPIPMMRDGVPFRLRALHIEVSRSGGFTFNPTNCGQHTILTTLTGSQGTSVPTSTPFTVAGCSKLPFHPKLSAATAGKTSKLNGASLTVKVSQQAGEANIQKVDLQIPNALPSRLTTLNHACTSQQFETNPAGCPAASVIGQGTAMTPILPTPLTGPAYIVSHGGAAFPDVEFVLQSGGPQGVLVVLDGTTQIKKGITYSRFETVPDAPITAFEANLPEGPHSILAANVDLCARTKVVIVKKRVRRRVHGKIVHVVKRIKRVVATSLVIPATVVGQNGAQANQNLAVAVTGCTPPKKHKVTNRSRHKKARPKHH